MKKVIVFSLVLALALTLTGCIKFRTDLTVNQDGSGKVNYSVGFNSLVYQMMKEEQQQDPLAEMRAAFEEQEYQVERFNNNNLVGINASKEVENVAEIESVQEILQANQQGSNQELSDSGLSLAGLEVENGVFYNTYTYNDTVNMKELAAESTGDQMADNMRDTMLEQIDFGFKINLPVKAEEHNATSVAEDGKQLTWDFKPGEENEVHLKVKSPNYFNMTAAGVITFLLIGAFIFFFLRPSKEKQNY
ncbi:MAG: LppM family (lipo)protein [Bacillota bacterium]